MGVPIPMLPRMLLFSSAVRARGRTWARRRVLLAHVGVGFGCWRKLPDIIDAAAGFNMLNMVDPVSRNKNRLLMSGLGSVVGASCPTLPMLPLNMAVFTPDVTLPRKAQV